MVGITLQGYLAHNEQRFPRTDPTVGICLGPYGDPRGGVVFNERGTPVHNGRRTDGWKADIERRSVDIALATTLCFYECPTVQSYLTYKKTQPLRTLP